jgi:hypothetical protein
LQRIDITYDEPGPDEAKRLFPLYSIVYSNDPLSGAKFSIESAREGIGTSWRRRTQKRQKSGHLSGRCI